MITRQVDVAVIGAGSAGMNAFRAAKERTNKVLLIESGEYGTTCARVGCMPSKLLIAAAEAAHNVAEASGFGINPLAVEIDGVAVMERVRTERDRFVGFAAAAATNEPMSQRLIGRAKFLDDNTLVVDDHTVVKARSIVIATGSRPVYPRSFESLGDRLMVNDDVFEWRDLPNSIAVFGPGVIGLELGQALSRLGVRTHMFGLGGQVGPLTDPSVMASATQTLSKEFYLNANANVTKMVAVEEGVLIEYQDQNQSQSIVVDNVIASTGRAPNVGNLGLENTTLVLDDKGVPVFDSETMQAGASSIFIAGDANNQKTLLHEAVDEGRIAGKNAATYPVVDKGLRTSPLGVVFTDPQMAMVGSTYRELKGKGVVIGEVSFEGQGRSRVMRQNKGLLRVYADCVTGQFLGAEMFGPRVEHLGHLLAWAHQAEMTIEQMLQMPFYHPVIEEGLRTALRDAKDQLQTCLPKAA
ncbi:MAG: dihydrolipoyl dehydrogenase [Pseudomonadota bacterium]